MKKLFLIIICVFLVSCNSDIDIITEDHFGNPIELDDYEYVGTFENGDVIYVEPYRNYMQDAAWSMILVRNEKIIKLFDGYPSRPKFNKDRTKILYVSCLQFELTGDVTIYDSEEMNETSYTNYEFDDTQMTVKDVEWYKDDTILCIIGYGMGTVTQGGELYHLNLSTKKMEKVIPNDKFLEWTERPYEVADVYISENGLDITLVEWADDNYEEYYYTVHHIFIDETNIK